MDVVPPKKKWLQRLGWLEASAVTFGPRPPRGPGGGGLLFGAFVAVLVFKGTEKAVHSLRAKASF